MDQRKSVDLKKYLAARLEAAKNQLDSLGSLDYKSRGKKSGAADGAKQLKIEFKNQ